MTGCNIKIHGDGPLSHVIEIDGHPVQNALQSLSLEMQAADLPVLTLRLVQARGTRDIDKQAIVRLDEDTAAALKAMGWTPPAEVAE